MRSARLITMLLALGILFALAALALPLYAMPAVTVRGYAWIDANCDGVRDDDEALAENLAIYLYSFGPDGVPFTNDDLLPVQLSGSYGTPYSFTRGATSYQYRLSIIQGTRPTGFIPTRYRQGSDPTRWSSLQSNWTTTGFQMSETETVDGGNIGIAPTSCTQVWYPYHTNLPVVAQ